MTVHCEGNSGILLQNMTGFSLERLHFSACSSTTSVMVLRSDDIHISDLPTLGTEVLGHATEFIRKTVYQDILCNCCFKMGILVRGLSSDTLFIGQILYFLAYPLSTSCSHILSLILSAVVSGIVKLVRSRNRCDIKIIDVLVHLKYVLMGTEFIGLVSHVFLGCQF